MGIGPPLWTRARSALLAAIALALALSAPAAAADRFVYVSEGFPAGNQQISALKINPNGSLTDVTGSPFNTGGTLTEGLALTPDAKHLYVANFGGPDVRAFNIGSDGGLAFVNSYPTGAGNTPLGVAPAPDGSHLFVWNHGSSIGVWTIASNGTLTQIGGSPFPVQTGHTNPFAGSVAPNGSHVYVPQENTTPGGGAPDTVGVFTIGAGGGLTFAQGATAGGPNPADGNPFGSGITPDGKFLYVSAPEDNASVGDVYGYSVDATTGLLTALPGSPYAVTPGGSHPLTIAVAPDGKHLYVATRASSVVKAYTINSDGSLTSIGAFATGGTNGKSLALTPDGKRLYVSNNGSNNISGFDVHPDGSLTLITGSPWPTGSTGNPDLESIAITPNQAPAAALSVHTGNAGQPTGFDASSSVDPDGRVTSYDWDFGDGTTLTDGGPIPNHIYDHTGTYTARVTVTDNEGCSATRIFTGKATLCNGSPVATVTKQVTVKKDTLKPLILSASASPKKFRNSTTFRYSLSESAKVVFKIFRKNGHTRLAKFSQKGDLGANAKGYSRQKGNLGPGRYRAELVAADSAGNRSPKVTVGFRVVP